MRSSSWNGSNLATMVTSSFLLIVLKLSLARSTMGILTRCFCEGKRIFKPKWDPVVCCEARRCAALQIGELLAGLGDEVLSSLVHPRGLAGEFLRVVVPEPGLDVGPGDLV